MENPTSTELVRGHPARNERSVRPSSKDMEVLLYALGTGTGLEAEDLNGDRYLERVVAKPWGHEYRIYADHFYDVWKLCLLPHQATSVHCHPRKDTALLCLSGTGEIRFLDASYTVRSGDIVHIPRATFHGTTNVSTSVRLDLVEVEVPRNKLDLVRLDDNYGRKGMSYERKTLEAAIGGLKLFRHTSECKVRRRSMNGSYRFVVRAGMDIKCRPETKTLFAVSLSVFNACVGNLEVTSGPPSSVDNNNFYLTICRT